MAKPEIRLNGFEGEWESPLLEAVFELRNGYTPSKMISEFWTNGTIPWFRLDDIRVRGGILSESFQKITSIAVKSSGLFNPYSIIMATTATVGIHAMPIVEYVANQQFTNFSIRKKLKEHYDPYYVYYKFYSIDEWAKRNTNSGGLLAVDLKSLIKIPFYSPLIDEQRLLADYFKSLDSMIQGVAKKIALLKQMKQACLISMFPQEGETTPRVRFKGFKGEWEDVCFKDISYPSGVRNRDNLPLESYSISNEMGFVPQNEQFENGGTMSSADKRLYYIVSPDSFAYNPARINIGSIGYDDLDKDVIVSSLYVVFKTDEDTYNPFLNYWFKTPTFKKLIELYQEGGVRLYFFYDKLCQCHFRRPCLDEQKKIASFFSSLDSQISLQEQCLEKLKQIKSACLDKMFV